MLYIASNGAKQQTSNGYVTWDVRWKDEKLDIMSSQLVKVTHVTCGHQILLNACNLGMNLIKWF